MGLGGAWSFPFAWRVAALILFAAVVSLADLLKRGRNSTRWREYGFVIVCGVIGAAVGGVNDAMTSSISPDYFVLGKDLPEGSGLKAEAATLGLEAGFSAGVIGGALAVYAGRRKSAHPPAEFACMLRLLWLPVAGAVVGGMALTSMARFDPIHLSGELGSVLSTEQLYHFRLVWWIHCGLYLGLLAGVATMVVQILRARRGRKILASP